MAGGDQDGGKTPVSFAEWIDDGGLIVIRKNDEDPLDEGHRYAAKAYPSEEAFENRNDFYGGFGDTVVHAMLNLEEVMTIIDVPRIDHQLDDLWLQIQEPHDSKQLTACTRDLYFRLREVTEELLIFIHGAAQITEQKRQAISLQCLMAIEALQDVKTRLGDQSGDHEDDEDSE